jgi:hypothetical protein
VGFKLLAKHYRNTARQKITIEQWKDSFHVMPLTGLKRPNTGKDDADDE